MFYDEVMNHEEGRRYGFLKLNAALLEFAKLNDDGNDLLSIQHWKEKWEEVLLIDYINYSSHLEEITNIIIKMSVHIFTEIARAHFCLKKADIIRDKKDLESVFGLYDDVPNMFSYCLRNTSHYDSNTKISWDKAVLMYNQQDLVDCLLMITERIDQLPITAVEETKTLYDMLLTRYSMQLCVNYEEQGLAKEIFNVNFFVTEENNLPNREYLTFCSIYFHVIWRRLHYIEMIPKAKEPIHVSPESVQRCQKWLEDIVCKQMSTEVFEDMYTDSCEESYVFPGDEEWFKFRFPDRKNYKIIQVLQCFRKEMEQKYHTERGISRETVLAAINQTSHTGQCARAFAINAIDQYIRTNFNNYPWKDSTLISNDQLESAENELLREKDTDSPLMVQVFGRYYVYHVAHIYCCDDLYETFTIWLTIIDRKVKKSVKQFWKPLIQKILVGKTYEPIPVYKGKY